MVAAANPLRAAAAASRHQVEARIQMQTKEMPAPGKSGVRCSALVYGQGAEDLQGEAQVDDPLGPELEPKLAPKCHAESTNAPATMA
jgi:hypothetical protein